MTVQYLDSAVAQKAPPFFSTVVTELPKHSRSGLGVRYGKSMGLARAATDNQSSFFVLNGYAKNGVRARETLVFSINKKGRFYIVELLGANIATSDTSLNSAVDSIVEEAMDLVFMAGQGEISKKIQQEVDVIHNLFDFDGRA